MFDVTSVALFPVLNNQSGWICFSSLIQRSSGLVLLLVQLFIQIHQQCFAEQSPPRCGEGLLHADGCTQWLFVLLLLQSSAQCQVKRPFSWKIMHLALAFCTQLWCRTDRSKAMHFILLDWTQARETLDCFGAPRLSAEHLLEIRRRQLSDETLSSGGGASAFVAVRVGGDEAEPAAQRGDRGVLQAAALCSSP